MTENPIPDSISDVPNATNATQAVESEFGAGHEGKIKKLVGNSDSTVCIIPKHVLFHLNQHRLTHVGQCY